MRWISAALAAVIASMGAGPAIAQDKKPYVIYLSNNFVGNDWRQQMERVATVAAGKAPLAGRVDLKIENAEGTVQAQISSLTNIIRQKPDAILIDASSAEALNPTIQKACDAGIVVISFDQTVSAECAYKLHSDFDIMANNQAEWMATILGGKGKVLMDRGLAGAPISELFEKNYSAVLKKYPGIEIVGYFNGNYAAGRSRKALRACWPHIPRSTASSPRATGPAQSTPCRMQIVPWCPSSRPRSTELAWCARKPRARNAGSAQIHRRCRLRPPSSQSISSTARNLRARPSSSTRQA